MASPPGASPARVTFVQIEGGGVPGGRPDGKPPRSQSGPGHLRRSARPGSPRAASFAALSGACRNGADVAEWRRGRPDRRQQPPRAERHLARDAREGAGRAFAGETEAPDRRLRRASRSRPAEGPAARRRDGRLCGSAQRRRGDRPPGARSARPARRDGGDGRPGPVGVGRRCGRTDARRRRLPADRRAADDGEGRPGRGEEGPGRERVRLGALVSDPRNRIG